MVASYDRTLSEQYAEDGAVEVGPVLRPEDVDDVRANLQRYATTVVPRMAPEIRAKTIRFEPDGKTLRVLYHLQAHDEFFSELPRRSSLMDAVRRITGWQPEVVAVESRHKAARIGTPVAMHQECWYHRPDPSPRAILWIALDPVTADNAGVRFWLGTHRYGLFEHVSNPPRFDTIADPKRVQRLTTRVLTCTLERGHATLHDGLVVHDSPANTSSTARLAIACEYRRAAR